MPKEVKCGNYNMKIVASIFTILGLVAIGSMIAMLLTPNWISLENSSSVTSTLECSNCIFAADQFKGSLYRCQEGCTNTYNIESEMWCDEADLYEKTLKWSVKCIEDEQCSKLRTLCTTFSNLYFISWIVIVCESASIIGMIIWLIFMWAIVTKLRFFKSNFFALICSCVFHCAGFIAWLVVTGGFNTSNCDKFANEGSRLIFCSTQGPLLGMFLLFFMPALAIVYLSILINSKYSLVAKGERHYIYTYRQADADADAVEIRAK